MGLFDRLKNMAEQIPDVTENRQNVDTETKDKIETIVFEKLPDGLEAFKALPQAAMTTPFDTAALTVVALYFYPKNKDVSLQMLDFLRGQRPLNGMDKQFINDRFRGKDYLPRAYFKGAVPENDYVPSEPYTVELRQTADSYEEEGFAKLFITCGGADSPRPLQLRKAKDGKWYLWEQFLLVDIRKPESTNPWA